MQVSDLVNQYQNSFHSGSKIAGGTKGVEQLTKTVSSLSAGQIFEGTVNAVKGSKVTLGLSSGQTISARLEKGVSLSPGQSVFFQVKSNEGSMIQIRPVSADYGSNLTLLNALDAAGIPKSEGNLNMVNAMMHEQMPIDAKSVNDMARLVTANPGTDVSTVVTMNKLDIPITPEMTQQFENYKASEGAILNTVKDLSTAIPTVMEGEQLSAKDVAAFQKEFVAILTEGAAEGAAEAAASEEQAAPVTDAKTAAQTPAAETAQVSAGAVSTEPNVSVVRPDGTQITITAEADAPGAATHTADAADGKQALVPRQEDFANGTVGRALPQEQMQSLSALIREHPALAEQHPALFDENGNLNPNASASDLMKALTEYFSSNTNLSKPDIMKFVSSEPYQNLLQNMMEDKWTLEPKDLTERHKIDELYEKISRDMEKIQSAAAHAAKSTDNPISQSASGIRDNLSFIQQVNQMYTYIQLPLRLSGQHTTGDLYVYSNKKTKRQDSDEITAFLHFDMDHLGSTDISVRMKDRSVDTRFFMEDDLSFQLIENNIHTLEEKLNSLGYSCRIDVVNDGNKVNFVEDFLKKDAGAPTTDIQRYSFDVRA